MPKATFSTLLALFLLLAAATGALAENCDTCHRHDLRTAEGGALCIHPQAFAATVHAGLLCSDCHKGATLFPHEKSLSVRCDLPCHVPGASHGKLQEAIAAGPHAALDGGNKPACIACHDSSDAKTLKGATGDALCQGCHSGLESVTSTYPTALGSFGQTAHDAAGERKPGCASCHPSHETKKGDGVRSCAKTGCHDGATEEFAALYSHSKEAEGGFSPARIGLLMTLALCGLLALRAARG